MVGRCRAGDTLGFVSLKELLVEQKFYLSTMALRVEVSIAIGKQSYLLSGLCGRLVSGFIILSGPSYSRKVLLEVTWKGLNSL